MYSNSYYYDTGGASWWIWPLVIIAIAVAGFLVYLALKKRFHIRTQIGVTKSWVMYKISVPKEAHASEDEQRKNFQEMLSVIEPFYANLESFLSLDLKKKILGQDHITTEIVAKEGRIYLYLGCPQKIAQSIERNLLAQYPYALIEPSEDYSIFPPKTLKVAVYNLGLTKKYFFPIRTYKNLEEDPLNAITSSLSKLGEEQTAGIQILIRPVMGMWRSNAEKIAYNIQQGKSGSYYTGGKLAKTSEHFFKFVGNVSSTAQGKTDANKNPNYNPESPYKMTPMQENQIKLLGEKASKIGFEVQIRIVTVAKTQEEADQQAKNITASFSQFTMPDANGFFAKKAKLKSEEAVNYALRLFGRGMKYILNTEELASIFHLPNRFTDTPNISWLLAKREAPPPNLSAEGTILGNSIYRGETRPVRIKDEDRPRHIYMVGKTGTGKTTLFENLIMQDIAAGKGVAYLDPNGDAAEWILNRIPKERAEDVIYFNPADTERPMGLNMLEWKTPEQRDFLIQEAVQMFYKLFDPGQIGIVGPQFEHWMRNAALTLMSQPECGTLVDIPRLFTDSSYEKECLKNVTDPVVRAFWEKQMAKTSDFHKSEMLNYFTSKFGRFMTNDMMRNIIGQSKSAFDFRQVMDGKKILICNLSKGLIGEINAFLLGMIIVSKIAMGAFSRQNIQEDQRIPFYLYVDEFQNFITDIFATILSESRKYKLSLNITNQYIAQMDEPIRNAVIGNVGTLLCFRVGAADAEFLIKEFDPLKIDDLTNIDRYNFYIKMLIDGAPTRPFNAMGVAPDPNQDVKLGKSVKELSRLKYGRPKEVVDVEIRKRSQVDKIDLPGINQNNDRGIVR